jgi:hypothetical protein
MAEQVYEVLTRRVDGHETVLRVAASNKKVAVDRAVERYSVDREAVVDTTSPRPI